jgi:hypothetical protein
VVSVDSEIKAAKADGHDELFGGWEPESQSGDDGRYNHEWKQQVVAESQGRPRPWMKGHEVENGWYLETQCMVGSRQRRVGQRKGGPRRNVKGEFEQCAENARPQGERTGLEQAIVPGPPAIGDGADEGKKVRAQRQFGDRQPVIEECDACDRWKEQDSRQRGHEAVKEEIPEVPIRSRLSIGQRRDGGLGCDGVLLVGYERVCSNSIPLLHRETMPLSWGMVCEETQNDVLQTVIAQPGEKSNLLRMMGQFGRRK